MTDHHSYIRNLSSSEKKAWKKNSGLNGIRTHDLCDTGAVLWSLCEFVIYPLRWWPRTAMQKMRYLLELFLLFLFIFYFDWFLFLIVIKFSFLFELFSFFILK